ncbi:MAG: HTH-type transcriptional regulator HmrR [Luteibacter sp.]|uniref:MerR family transcriptional regulator n=1 Tax=Luteibacter sp. TaxID=1886636 RepID=UPI00137FED00|nr:helix-turn-helix domain-containing protein [Luteibacter sp.]KAF1006871.1 MAG: HTH-type transcriptional regulator HmrR [Luteibacter sp.]
MRISQLAERTGCHLETIRYYERIGLLAEPARTASRYRMYGEPDAERLGFIMRCRGLGFTIEDIRSLLALTADDTRSCDEVDVVVRHHLADIERKQRELAAMADTLRASLANCARTTVGECTVSRRLHGTSLPA